MEKSIHTKGQRCSYLSLWLIRITFLLVLFFCCVISICPSILPSVHPSSLSAYPRGGCCDVLWWKTQPHKWPPVAALTARQRRLHWLECFENLLRSSRMRRSSTSLEAPSENSRWGRWWFFSSDPTSEKIPLIDPCGGIVLSVLPLKMEIGGQPPSQGSATESCSRTL